MFYRSSPDADKVADSLSQEFKGQTFQAIQCDVTDQKKVGEAFEKVVEGGVFKGGLHGVVAVSRHVFFYAFLQVGAMVTELSILLARTLEWRSSRTPSKSVPRSLTVSYPVLPDLRTRLQIAEASLKHCPS